MILNKKSIEVLFPQHLIDLRISDSALQKMFCVLPARIRSQISLQPCMAWKPHGCLSLAMPSFAIAAVIGDLSAQVGESAIRALLLNSFLAINFYPDKMSLSPNGLRVSSTSSI